MNYDKKIIVIDDDKSIRNVLQEYLQKLGYQVILAIDGLEGMDRLKQESYDLVIVDIRMPYISGIGLIKLIKEEKPDLPVICITAYGMSPEKIANEEQADVTISKPFNLKTLAKEINKLLAPVDN